jgi:hypothetical protein
MATYGRDFYGLAKYGSSVFTDFDINPFDAQPDGYNAIRVTWHSPSGTWQGLRLLRSRYGYAVNENDGEILIDTASSASEFVDRNLNGGAWYYYTLYVKVSGVWQRAGATSSLAVRETGFRDLLWDRVPKYFQYAPRFLDGGVNPYYSSAEVYDPDRYDQKNQELRQFLDILAWGLDWVRNYHDTTLWANDPRRIHLENLDRLARQLGTTYEYEIPARVLRGKVANAALLARRRGTLDGLRDAVNLSTGWDVDLEVGVNRFLNEDQSSFSHPQYSEWSPAVNYANGDRVQFAGRIMQAKPGGAYGDAQKPPTAPTTSNTWWTIVDQFYDAIETLRDDATASYVGWKAFRSSGPWYGDETDVVVGVSSPVDTTLTNSNTLRVGNWAGSAYAMELWGAANVGSTAAPLPEAVVRQGIPIPRALTWSPSENYQAGTIVLYGSRTYRALRENTGRNPTAYTMFWEKVGADERVRLAFSFYSHAQMDGSAGVAVTPGIAFYDERGTLIKDVQTASSSQGLFFDTFNQDASLPWASRTPDHAFSSEKWVLNTGNWDVAEVSNSERYAYPLTPTAAVTTVTMPSEKNFYKVAVTFKKPALSGATQALVLRYVDANNYLRVTRTLVQKMAAGVLTTVATLSTPVSDGDRVTVLMDETANTQTVYVNNVQVASVSGQPQPAAGVGSNRYRHGLMVI